MVYRRRRGAERASGMPKVSRNELSGRRAGLGPRRGWGVLEIIPWKFRGKSLINMEWVL